MVRLVNRVGTVAGLGEWRSIGCMGKLVPRLRHGFSLRHRLKSDVGVGLHTK